MTQNTIKKNPPIYVVDAGSTLCTLTGLPPKGGQTSLHTITIPHLVAKLDHNTEYAPTTVQLRNKKDILDQYVFGHGISDNALMDTTIDLYDTKTRVASIYGAILSSGLSLPEYNIIITVPLDAIFKLKDGVYVKDVDKVLKIRKLFNDNPYINISPNRDKQVKLNCIDVKPEGLATLFDVYYDDLGKPVKNLQHDTNFICDLGSATTQLLHTYGTKITKTNIDFNVNGTYFNQRIIARYKLIEGTRLTNTQVNQMLHTNSVNPDILEHTLDWYIDELRTTGLNSRSISSGKFDHIIITGSLATLLGKERFADLLGADNIVIAPKASTGRGVYKVHLNKVSMRKRG